MLTTEVLNVSVLYGDSPPNPAIPEILAEIPKVRLLCQAAGPKDLESHSFGVPLDCVLVYLDGEQTLPEWLQDLAAEQPHTAIMLCSARMEPEFLIQAMQRGVREILPLPLAKSDLEAAFGRIRMLKRRVSDPMATKGRILVVTSHKGGLGTTTVAVNLALALAELQSQKLALLDLGRPFPDVGNFLDVEAPYNLYDLIQNVYNLDRAFLEKIIQPYEDKLAIIHGISDFKEQDSLDLEAMDKIFAFLRATYPWTIIDLSHWLDELFVKVLGEADVVIMLTTLTVPNLRNLGYLWPMLRQWQLVQNKVKLVVNNYEKGTGLSLRNLDQVIKEPAFAALPADGQNASEAINRGVPLAKIAPNSKLWLAIMELAQKLHQEAQPQEEAAAGNGTRPRRRFWIF